MAHTGEPAAARPFSTLIDVLIPVFNGGVWLRPAIESIQQQSHANLCIQVVDDGSTDGTPELLATLAAGDSRIRVHRKPNGGIVEALNHGLTRCTADWVARHDADDLAHPQRLRSQLEYLHTHPACVAVSAMARHIDADGRPLGTVTRLRPPGEADAHWVPAREPYLMHPLLMVRRHALRAVGGYRFVSNSEDSDLYWRLRDIGGLHNLPEVLGDYRVHAGSVSSSSIRGGRLMAIGSQLAALSARRRAAGRTDLPFDKARNDGLRAVAVSLNRLADLAEADVDAEERPLFRLAVAAKLLELASYQPYELALEDCRFVRRATRLGASLSTPANTRALAGALTRAAVRLSTAGRWGDALALLPVRLLPEFAARHAVYAGLPAGARQGLRAAMHRVHRRFSGARQPDPP